MVQWVPEVERVRLRNGTVVSVSGGNAQVRLDGSSPVVSAPVYGSVAVGQGCLVLEQGGSRLVLGRNNLLVGGEALSIKGGTVDATFMGFYPDAQDQNSRFGWIGYGSAGTDDLRVTNDRGPLTLKGSPDVRIDGAGITYPGATHGGGTANRIGFRWASPNIVTTVDNVVSAVAATVSTGRLKANVRAVGAAVATIARLRPVEYTPLELDGTQRADAGTHIGLIAEEVAEVVPSAVLRADDGTAASVNYMELVPLLAAAVQELAARVSALEEGGA